MLQQLWAIGRNTFTESIRQPIFVVLILIALIALILNPMVSSYTLDDDNLMMIDMGCSTLFVAGLLLAAFTATGVLSQEIENRTVLTVVSKPVSRPLFVVGKFLGVGAALGTAYWILSIAFLMTVRHRVLQAMSDPWDGPVLVFGFSALFLALLIAVLGNYFYQWVFTSSFIGTLFLLASLAMMLVLFLNKEWEFQSPTAEFTRRMVRAEPVVPMDQIFLGLMLIFEAVMVLTAVAIAASTRLGQVMNLVVCLGVFSLGLVSEYLSHVVEKPFEFTAPSSGAITVAGTLATSQPAALEPSLAEKVGLVFSADKSVGAKAGFFMGKAIYYVTPNLQFFWPSYGLIEHNDFSLNYMLWTSGYALLLTCMILFLAVALFQTREVG